MATILVVDDDANNRELLKTILSHAGHNVVEAADGVEGLRLVTELQPDLAIVDLRLPRLSGTELIKQVRSGRNLARVRLALYTATRSDAAMEQFTELYGVARTIPKPSEPAEVIAIVSAILASDDPADRA